MRAAAGLAAAALIGCGSEPAPALSIDSHGWLCESQPPEVPDGPWPIAETQLDAVLPSFELDDHGARGLVQAPTGVVVYTPRARHLVTLDGTVTTATYDPEFPSRMAMLEGVAAGATLGAIIETEVGSQTELQFCIFDGADLTTPPRCTELDGNEIAGARLSFDGTRFRAHTVVDGAVHRWIFDAQPGLVAEDDLWATVGLDREVLAVVSTPDSELVITRGTHPEGAACATYQVHQSGAAEHRWESLLPSELTIVPERNYAFAISTAGRAALVSSGTCIANLRGCGAVTGWEWGLSFLATGDAANGLSNQPLAIPGHFDSAVFFDATSTVVLFGPHPTWLLSRFAADGSIERSQIQLGGRIGGVTAGLALDRSDYVIVYEAADPHETRVRRILVP